MRNSINSGVSNSSSLERKAPAKPPRAARSNSQKSTTSIKSITQDENPHTAHITVIATQEWTFIIVKIMYSVFPNVSHVFEMIFR